MNKYTKAALEAIAKVDNLEDLYPLASAYNKRFEALREDVLNTIKIGSIVEFIEYGQPKYGRVFKKNKKTIRARVKRPNSDINRDYKIGVTAITRAVIDDEELMLLKLQDRLPT